MADIEQVRFQPVTYVLRSKSRRLAGVIGFFLALMMATLTPPKVLAAPYAAMVMDARTGEVLHSRNADTQLHPASLTKMMTLYIAFEAVRNGEITLDTKVRVSSNAAAEPPSKLGLKSGQSIALRYLIRASAVKSANDAATAIGEALSGSEAAFARRMTRTAKALGMSRTTFKNAHGLTETGHLSTANDMTILGRHILYDYPEYYHLFSRQSADAGIRTVPNTNRRLLAAYNGADGIKTGYTRAAGFNLVASAKRGNERIIATVFGGKSSTSRNAKVAELLDLGFRRAPSQAKLRKPAMPAYVGNPENVIAVGESHGVAGKTIRVSGRVETSLRPRARPGAAEAPVLLAEAQQPAAAEEILSQIGSDTQTPRIDPEILQASVDAAIAEATVVQASATPAPATESTVKTFIKGLRPQPRPSQLADAATAAQAEPVVITRLSTSGGRYWGINVGRYTNRYEAEKVLLRTALAEMETLNGSLRKVSKSRLGFEANFLGMTQESAELACRRLSARNINCETLGPPS